MYTKLALALAVSLILGFTIPSALAHTYDDSKIKTVDDIVDYCEFYYDEYKRLGERTLYLQHNYEPKLRFCLKLYSHIVWPTEHPDRTRILVSEITKMLGSSGYVKERHLGGFATFPDWIKTDAKLWVSKQITDSRFAYGIRAIINAEIISPPIIHPMENRFCNDVICIEKADFVKYAVSDNYHKDTVIEKYTVSQVSLTQVKVDFERTSQEGRENIEITIDQGGSLYDILRTFDDDTIQCHLGSTLVKVYGVPKCQDNDSGRVTQPKSSHTPHKFVYPVPIEIGDKLDGTNGELTVTHEVLTSFKHLQRDAFVARDSTGKYSEIIDAETGLILSSKFEDIIVVPVWEKTELIDTNIFEKQVGIQLGELVIPEWWKKNTSWFLDGLITEADYLKALEYLIGKQIIRV